MRKREDRFFLVLILMLCVLAAFVISIGIKDNEEEAMPAVPKTYQHERTMDNLVDSVHFFEDGL